MEPEDQPGPNAMACQSELQSAGVLMTQAGILALSLAVRMDRNRFDSGSAVASLARQYQAAFDRAIGGVEPKGNVDIVEGIFS